MKVLGIAISGGKCPAWLNVSALLSIVFLVAAMIAVVVHQYDYWFHADAPFYFYTQHGWASVLAQLGLPGVILFFFCAWMAQKYET